MRASRVFYFLIAVAGFSFAETAERVPLPIDSPGRSETLALARAYPDRISDVEYRDGDWAVRVDDVWFYWAGARLLPFELRDRWSEYASHRFYSYQPGLPPLRPVDPETAASLRNRVQSMDSAPPVRNPGFLDALYRSSGRSETLANIVDHTFLGFRTQVHRHIVPALDRVEAEITALLPASPEVTALLEDVRLVGAFSWRVIAGTGTRSYHSYGAALDFIPHYYERKQAYWRWAMESGIEDWWAVPYERRWMPPLAVIEAFENHGFVWGGKWLFFDTIHFEYRPEIRILSRLNGSNRADSRLVPRGDRLD